MPNKANGLWAAGPEGAWRPDRVGRGSGGQAARVSRVPLGLTQEPLIPTNTRPLRTRARAQARPRAPRAQGRRPLWDLTAGSAVQAGSRFGGREALVWGFCEAMREV